MPPPLPSSGCQHSPSFNSKGLPGFVCPSLARLPATWPRLGRPLTPRVTQTLPVFVQAELCSRCPSPWLLPSARLKSPPSRAPATPGKPLHSRVSVSRHRPAAGRGQGQWWDRPQPPPGPAQPSGRVAGAPPPPLPKAARRRRAASLEPRSQLPPRTAPRIQE